MTQTLTTPAVALGDTFVRTSAKSRAPWKVVELRSTSFVAEQSDGTRQAFGSQVRTMRSYRWDADQ